MNSFVAARTLTEYPRGRHRWALLILTVLASILGAYDFQLAPLLPILLPYLHMSHTAYGAFIAFTVLISGISAFFGGPLADRYGRVPYHRRMSRLRHRAVVPERVDHQHHDLRDPAPVDGNRCRPDCRSRRRTDSRHVARLSRALAFGLLTIGPVGANFLANFVAGATLPIYHTWQSQIWIMGFFRGRDVHPDRVVAVRPEPRTAHADHED